METANKQQEEKGSKAYQRTVTEVERQEFILRVAEVTVMTASIKGHDSFLKRTYVAVCC